MTGHEREPRGRGPSPDHHPGLLGHSRPLACDHVPHDPFGDEFEAGHDECGGRETRPPRGQGDHRDDRPDGEHAEVLHGMCRGRQAVRETVDP